MQHYSQKTKGENSSNIHKRLIKKIMVYSYNRVLFGQKRNEVLIHVKTGMNLENIIYMKKLDKKRLII